MLAETPPGNGRHCRLLCEILKRVSTIDIMGKVGSLKAETNMRLFLTIFLMPMVLASQSLCAVHVHIGTHSAELGSHAGVPHFHAEAGHGHSHRHGGLHSKVGGSGRETANDPQPGIKEFPDDHVGAYYVSDSVSRDTNRLDQDRLAELLLVKFVGHEMSRPALGSCLIPNEDGQRDCFLSGIARVPLFLRDASIRC